MRTSLCSWSGRDDTHPTARTAHPPDWHIQPDAPPQQVTFANAPQRRLMDAGTSLAAPATARQRLGLRPQHQQQALIAQFMDIVKFEAFPEQGKHFRLCHGGGPSQKWIGVVSLPNLSEGAPLSISHGPR